MSPLPAPVPWHENRDTVHAVATYGHQEGLLSDPSEILYFFEKPWKYEEIYDAWTEAGDG